jgi:tetratricopeptide (TPR) repeat protein
VTGLRAVLTAALVLSLLEGAARLSPPPPEPNARQAQWLLESWAPYFRVETAEGRKVLVQNPTIMTDWPAQSFPLEKPAGARRIAVVGESSAISLGQTLREALDDRSGAAEVLNLAVSGGSLEQVERRLREALGYGPDAAVVMFGHNLFARRPYVTRGLYRAGRWLRTSRLFASAADALFPISWEHTNEPDRLARFERFLRSAARSARERDVALVFCTLPSNLRFPPRYNREELEAAERLESLYLRHAGDVAGALAPLEPGTGRKAPPLWTFEKAELLLALGRVEPARRAFAEARDADRDRTRASTAVNELVRRVAAEEKVSLLDAAALVEAQAPAGVPGWESFQDQMHVRWPLFRAEAAACARMLKARLGGLPDPVDHGPEERPDSALDFVRLALRHAEQPPHNFEEALSRKFQDALARKAKEELAELEGFLAGREPTIFEEVRDRELAHARLWLAWGKALGRLGRRPEAFAAFAEARRLGASWAQPDLWEGIVRLDAGDPAAAAAAFDEALRKAPSNASAQFLRRKIKL